jgi:hypothetical protein
MRINKNEPIKLSDGSVLDPSVKVGVFDAAGQQVPYVFGFDTETCEVEMLIKLKDESATNEGEKLCYFLFGEDLKPLVAKFVLPGAYVMDERGNILT